jgi:prophage maintenance system killer protein
VEQTFSGQDLYPSVQEKAAHLLYFVVRDHLFSDGNKRSAAAVFTYYLSMNSALQRDSGEDIVSSNALAAITLMTAMSKPEEKVTIIQLLTNMLDDSSNRNRRTSRTAFAQSLSSGAGTVSGTTRTRRPPHAIRSSIPQNAASWNYRFELKKHRLSDTAARHPPPQTGQSNAPMTGRVRQLTRKSTDRCSPGLVQIDDRAGNDETLPRILRSVSLSGSS